MRPYWADLMIAISLGSFPHLARLAQEVAIGLVWFPILCAAMVATYAVAIPCGWLLRWACAPLYPWARRVALRLHPVAYAVMFRLYPMACRRLYRATQLPWLYPARHRPGVLTGR